MRLKRCSHVLAAVILFSSQLALGDDIQIVKSGYLSCHQKPDLIHYAAAVDYDSIYKLVSEKLYQNTWNDSCVVVTETRQIQNIRKVSINNGSSYYCFDLIDKVIGDVRDECTLPIFISTLRNEIRNRSGQFMIVEERPEGLLAKCSEGGGTVRIIRDDSGSIVRISRTFLGLFESEPPPVPISANPHLAITDGCRGKDYLDFLERK